LSQLTFWIAGTDTVRLRRWETLFTREGWQVATHSDIGALTQDAAQKRFGIVLFGHDLAGAKTAEGVKRVKAASAGISVILTSGPEIDPMQIIDILDAGADDHFPDQIDDRLLLAKLKAHLRRILPSLASALDVIKSPGGELKVDRSQQQAWSKGTRNRWVTVPGLTPTEFQFLSLFLERPGRVLERHFFLDSVWKGKAEDVRPGTVDKHVESLRRKLGKHGDLIKTVYGVGYALRDGE